MILLNAFIAGLFVYGDAGVGVAGAGVAHPYYCFRPDSGSSKGFSVGLDTDSISYDLPDKHHMHVPIWNSLIYTAISKDSVLPKNSTAKYTIIDHYGEGYDALYY